jgi:P-type conjugative transfer protein TrbJ
MRVSRFATFLPARAAGAAVLLAAALAAGAATPAAAQIPVTDALNAYWQALHYVQFAEQIYQQSESLVNQATQIENQLRALKKLAHPNWRDIGGLLAELDSLIRSGRSLAFNYTNISDQFKKTFPGWMRYIVPDGPQAQAERSLATFRAALATLSEHDPSLTGGEATLALIRQQMTTTQGTQQALEHLATISMFSAQEAILTRQALAVTANIHAVGSAYWIDREAQGAATDQDIARATALAAAQSSSPGVTALPFWLR